MNLKQNRVRPFTGLGWRAVGGAMAALLAMATFAWTQGDVQKDQSLNTLKERNPAGRRGMGPPRGGFGNPGDPLNGLSEEEKKRVRAVLAKVWQDPAVMAAKENVRISTDEYRETLQKAVTRVEPEIAALMKRFHEQSRSAGMRKQFDHDMGGIPGGRIPGGPKVPGRYGNGADLPEFFRALGEDEKKIFLEARNQATASERVLELRKELEELETREKGAREARFKLRMRMARVMREEMIKIDPRIARIAPDMPRPRPGRPQARPPGTDRPKTPPIERPQRPKAE